MTVFVSDTPDGAGRYLLWADTSDEAVIAVYSAGGDLSQLRADLNAWEAYGLTLEQFGTAIVNGAELTDKFGPAIWCARRDGDAYRLGLLLTARATGCA